MIKSINYLEAAEYLFSRAGNKDSLAMWLSLIYAAALKQLRSKK